VELCEQLNSLFGLRHCGRALPRRDHPSAYGQMGRCASPCLGDLDPNAYRRRLDAALALFTGSGDGAVALLEHVDARMREAAAGQWYERAAWLRRRRERLAWLLARVGDAVAATHTRPRLALATHPRAVGADAFWLVGGRIVDSGPVDNAGDVAARTEAALRGADDRRAPHLTPDDVAQTRIATIWLASNEAEVVDLGDEGWRERVGALVAGQEQQH
jgi:DNA polymerase III subunit epsilon